jgi:hypothetical protein
MRGVRKHVDWLDAVGDITGVDDEARLGGKRVGITGYVNHARRFEANKNPVDHLR